MDDDSVQNLFLKVQEIWKSFVCQISSRKIVMCRLSSNYDGGCPIRIDAVTE